MRAGKKIKSPKIDCGESINATLWSHVWSNSTFQYPLIQAARNRLTTGDGFVVSATKTSLQILHTTTIIPKQHIAVSLWAIDL
jgi:hypothetical protein